MSVDEGLVHAWLDGQLPPEEAARVEALVASDPAWREAAAEARGLAAGAARILGDLDAPPSARQAVAMGRMTASGGGGPAKGPRRRVAPWMRAAAGVVLVVGVGAVVWDSREDWFGPDGGVLVESVPAVPVVDSAAQLASAAEAAVADATADVSRPRPTAVGATASTAAAPPAAEKTGVDERLMQEVAPPVAARAAAAAVRDSVRVAEVQRPPTASDFAGRGVAGGRVMSDALERVCLVPLDSTGLRREGDLLRTLTFTVGADSSVSAAWTDSTGRSALNGRMVGDTVRGTVRVTAGDIRGVPQSVVLLRVVCP
jgi:hypothetical protein